MDRRHCRSDVAVLHVCVHIVKPGCTLVLHACLLYSVIAQCSMLHSVWCVGRPAAAARGGTEIARDIGPGAAQTGGVRGPLRACRRRPTHAPQTRACFRPASETDTRCALRACECAGATEGLASACGCAWRGRRRLRGRAQRAHRQRRRRDSVRGLRARAARRAGAFPWQLRKLFTRRPSKNTRAQSCIGSWRRRLIER